MEFIQEIFINNNFIQAIIVLSLVCAIGLALGRIKIFGVSLGVTFVFFTGILAGHFGVKINSDMLLFAQNFGLVLFIYALGVQVGPGFFSSFKHGGIKLNLLATAVLVVGTAMAIGLVPLTGIPMPDMMGLLSGAVTNTPMLGAGQQTLLQINPEAIEDSNRMALACAVGYPMGVIGVILSVIVLKVLFAKKYTSGRSDENTGNAYISEFCVSNPAIFGMNIKEIMQFSTYRFVISRVWKNGEVSIPTSETVLENGNHLLVISNKNDVENIKLIFGEKADKDWNKKDIDWDSIDRQLVSRHIFITKPELNGVKLGALKLRNTYGINITRVNRAGIDLFASPSLTLQLGDKLTVVGESNAIENVAARVGNKEKQLANPNLFAIFIGLAVGLVLGAIPLRIPGMSMPVKLGIAGGPIIVGILMGAFGPKIHLSTYTTRSANLMLRQLGIVLYLAGLGLSSGEHFFETVFRIEGLIWLGISFALATIPVLIVGFFASKFFNTDYASNVGMLCGSMANPIALTYANTTTDSDEPAVAYATVYPFSIFMRVITIQIIMIIFC